ncbi:MAG TPA: hypothetical protein VGM28_02475 [Candidatus Limnocylindrales bacterium]|jgi:hypothetical protein
MGPAVVIGGLVVLSLLVLGVTLGARPRPGVRRELPFRQALPFVAGILVAVAVVLAVLEVPTLVLVGLVAYVGVAATAVWRMARLDRGSRWMEPNVRIARLAISVVALTWLGIILGLLLWIAAYLAAGPIGP